MELKDTIHAMQSEDWKERLKAEYYQTRIRYDALDAAIIKHEAGELPELAESIDVIKAQGSAMAEYLYCLKIRLALAGVEISEYEEG